MIEIPEGVGVTLWCSLFCTGNLATGELVVESGHDFIKLPICDECKDKVEAGTQSRLDSTPEGMLD